MFRQMLSVAVAATSAPAYQVRKPTLSEMAWRITTAEPITMNPSMMVGKTNSRLGGAMWPLVEAMCVKCDHDSMPAPTVSRMTPPNTIAWMATRNRRSMARSRAPSVWARSADELAVLRDTEAAGGVLGATVALLPRRPLPAWRDPDGANEVLTEPPVRPG